VENNTQTAEANSFVADLRVVHDDLRKAIEDMQCCYQLSADKGRIPAPKIEVSDYVFILAKFIKSTQPTKKLAEKYLGFFEVIGKLDTHSYLIKLPTTSTLSIQSFTYCRLSQCFSAIFPTASILSHLL